MKFMLCKLYLNNAVFKKKLTYTISTYKKSESDTQLHFQFYTSPKGLRGDCAIGEKKLLDL